MCGHSGEQKAEGEGTDGGEGPPPGLGHLYLHN